MAADPFAGATILGAHEVAWAGGNLLLVVNTTRQVTVLSEAIDELLDRRVDAIVYAVVGTRKVTVPEAIKAIKAVLLNGYAAGGLLPSVLALNEAGLRVPEDVSVVGYDDQVDLAADITPALSTIRLPYYQMGRWVVEQLVSGNAAIAPSRTHLPCPAVPRCSVAPVMAGSRPPGVAYPTK